MPAPPTYIDITTTPVSRVVTVAEFNAGTFGGVANEVWFRYVVGVNPRAFGWFIGLATGFVPATNLYASDGSTLINGNTGDNAMWWPLANNSTYYVRIRKTIPGTIAFNFNTLFESASIGNLGTVPDGSWLVNDDGVSTGTTGFPSAVYSPDGDFIGFISGIPAGEIGDTLPDRTSLWHDRFGMYGGELALFGPTFTFIDDFTAVPSLGAPFPCICNDGTDFYVLNRNTNGVFKITAAGVMGSVLATLPIASNIQAMGVSRDGTIAYHARGDDSAVIGRHSLVTGLALSNLYTIPGFVVNVDYVAITAVNGHPGEILVLGDGTIATFWYDDSATTNYVLHLAADGTLLQSWGFSRATYGLIDHLHYSPNGPVEIYVWFFTSVAASQGRFGSVTFATGAFTELFEVDLTSIGENMIGASSQIFGPSASCSMTTVGYSEDEPEPEPPSGELGFERELPIRWVLRTGVLS